MTVEPVLSTYSAAAYPLPEKAFASPYNGAMRAEYPPPQALLLAVSGWVNRDQQHVMENLVEEKRVLKAQLGGTVRRLNHDQRPRLGLMKALKALLVRLALQNPWWGYGRIQGELKDVGHQVASTTIASVLKENGTQPAPDRPSS